MAKATEDKHRKVLVSPQTDEDKGMDGYAYVNGITVKYRFGEPTSLRTSVIKFLEGIEVVTRVHEEYTDIDKKRKKRVVRKAVPRYKVFELGKDYQLGPEFDGYDLDSVDTEGLSKDKNSKEADL